MPAQIMITHEQLTEMARRGHDVVVCEQAFQPGANVIDAHVMDKESLETDTYLSVVIDPEGKVLGEQRLSDGE